MSNMPIIDPTWQELCNPNYYQPLEWRPVYQPIDQQNIDTVTRTKEDILLDIEKLLQELRNV
jgi:hypothetical protein